MTPSLRAHLMRATHYYRAVAPALVVDRLHYRDAVSRRSAVRAKAVRTLAYMLGVARWRRR